MDFNNNTSGDDNSLPTGELSLYSDYASTIFVGFINIDNLEFIAIDPLFDYDKHGCRIIYYLRKGELNQLIRVDQYKDKPSYASIVSEHTLATMGLSRSIGDITKLKSICDMLGIAYTTIPGNTKPQEEHLVTLVDSGNNFIGFVDLNNLELLYDPSKYRDDSAHIS